MDVKQNFCNLFKKKVTPKNELGLTVVEIMVSVVIIAGVLLATAFGLTSAFKSSSNLENRNKADAIAQDVLAVAKQASFRELFLETQPLNPDLSGQGKCDFTKQHTVVESNTSPVIAGEGESYEGLVFCQAKQQGNKDGGVGTTFYVQTNIVYITGGGTNYFPKKVYVTVRWKDTSTTGGSFNEQTLSLVRTPNPSDCVPDPLFKTGVTGVAPLGCKPF